jgi:hypothetical protein
MQTRNPGNCLKHALGAVLGSRRCFDHVAAQPSYDIDHWKPPYLRFGADQQGYRLPRHIVAHSVDEYRTELQIPIAGI